ncbi:uncharacterized protein LOC119404441 isoform X2 [Rhipicephalus sanguineus]|uniref:uncharacterized protein LOC119404441 isoform X2 n=1 Tax=Rhipicephalus sanguineus TaxID=34632 RepID=UPI0018944FD1|nr:uncharacterized protein LOC119404441 isoform X2 [Rhipicephalus sanguineus]
MHLVQRGIILAKGIFLIWLSGLSLSEAVSYTPVEIISLVRIRTEGNKCQHSRWYFSSTVNVRDRCERLSCYAEDNVVVKLMCAPPPVGCHRESKFAQAPFPHCCRVSCPHIHVCVTDNGTVLTNGTSLNSADPCVRYQCRNGVLTKEVYTLPWNSNAALIPGNRDKAHTVDRGDSPPLHVGKSCCKSCT